MNKTFALFLAGAMVFGILAGLGVYYTQDAELIKQASGIFGLLPKVFIMLIKMIIAPLVLFTLIAGVGHMEDAAEVGRVGVKALAWFIVASIISLLLGMVMVEWLQPGVGAHYVIPDGASVKAPSTENFTFEKFLEHVIPTSIVKAMAENEILQIVIFAVFVGSAVAALDNKSPRIMELAEEAAAIMLKVTDMVMKFAPFAIFGALAKIVATQGPEILKTYAKFIGSFYFAIVVLWVIILFAGFVFLGKDRIIRLLKRLCQN